MQPWKPSSLLVVVLAAGCGLDAAGEAVSLDAAVPGLDAGGLARDATRGDSSRDATTPPPGHDASADRSAKDSAAGPDTNTPHDARGDSGGGLVDSSHEADGSDAARDAGVPLDAHRPSDAEADSPDDARPLDAMAHDAEPGDAARGDAGARDAEPPDAPAASDASGPPGFCIVSYGCGPSTCACSQTCSHGQCGDCVPGFATCGGLFGACRVDITTVANCGECGNGCSCPFGHFPSCDSSNDGGRSCHCS